MAKVSPVSIKYMIRASFKAHGPLEKPDVIGAIFGQTEGLLGEHLEMRELQKEGKIGRIEVDLQIVDGKSVGEIMLPSALDRSETTILAAALETIDRIGPTEAEIKVSKIEDVRGTKRDFIIQRAKALLEGISTGEEHSDMSKQVKEESRMERIQEYGDERLPAGDISGSEVIVVEGRADVINLLKNRVNNVIGMNGTKLPKEIAKLGETKEITLFVDGDRGGKLIAQNVINNANITYVAVAPDGKEVEELAGKEILLSLRKRMSVNEFMNSLNKNGFDNGSSDEEVGDKREVNSKDKEVVKNAFSKIKGTKNALLLDEEGTIIMKTNFKEVSRTLDAIRNKVFAVVVDGPATSALVRICDEKNVSILGATNFGSVEGARVNLVSL